MPLLFWVQSEASALWDGGTRWVRVSMVGHENTLRLRELREIWRKFL